MKTLLARQNRKRRLFETPSAIAIIASLVASFPAFGQSATGAGALPADNNQATLASPSNRTEPAPLSAQAANGGVPVQSDIMVTGTRVVRDGYKAPTPTSVIGSAEIYAHEDDINLCAQGGTAFCAGIIRNAAGVITQVNVAPFKVAKQIARGLDFEASYRRHVRASSFLDGSLTFRGLATRYLENYVNNGATPPNDNVGTNSNNGSALLSLPKWRYALAFGFI